MPRPADEYGYKMGPTPTPASSVPGTHSLGPPSKDGIGQLVLRIVQSVESVFNMIAEMVQRLFTNEKAVKQIFVSGNRSDMIDANYDSLRNKVARTKEIDKTLVPIMQIYEELCHQLNADLQRLGGLNVEVDGKVEHFKYTEDLFTFFKTDLDLPAEKIYRILAQLQQSVFVEFQIACGEKTGAMPTDLTLTQEGAKTGGWKMRCVVSNDKIQIDHEKNFSLQKEGGVTSTVSAHVGFIFPRNEEPEEAFFSWKILEV